MAQKKISLFYQPRPLVSTINWSWTFIMLLIGIIFWLEVTVLQWISFTFFGLFLIASILEISRRKLVIYDDKLIIKRLMRRKNLVINIKDIAQIKTISKREIYLRAHHQSYFFVLRPKTSQKLIQIVNKNK